MKKMNQNRGQCLWQNWKTSYDRIVIYTKKNQMKTSINIQAEENEVKNAQKKYSRRVDNWRKNIFSDKIRIGIDPGDETENFSGAVKMKYIR